MPEPVHLLISEPQRGDPSEVMKALKQGFRHYAYDEPGPVLVNEAQRAELRVRKIS